MKKILIVDDEFLIRFTLEEGLKDRGYETQSAETVKDALEKMKTFHPQVILLDNRLQDSLGIDEISTFRSADEEVQVILMTAYGLCRPGGGGDEARRLRLYFKAL